MWGKKLMANDNWKWSVTSKDKLCPLSTSALSQPQAKSVFSHPNFSETTDKALFFLMAYPGNADQQNFFGYSGQSNRRQIKQQFQILPFSNESSGRKKVTAIMKIFL